MSTNDNKPNKDDATDTKQISLADAMKQKLAQKKQAQSQGKARKGAFNTDTKKVQSQITKKPNNQKKRTGV